MEKRGNRGGSGSERGRWSSRRKMEVVLRVLRGEDLDALSRELGVTASRLAQWRDTFLDGAMAALKSRKGDHIDDRACWSGPTPNGWSGARAKAPGRK